ncbi:hypothetical protein CASFOL_020776 [Castilleja foliolosa]|uniref:Uncharacterized protein n=1 Tax=Castilleja foliolosa TaxID=1961234 RepID=A0ABD3D4L5_9LAMI
MMGSIQSKERMSRGRFAEERKTWRKNHPTNLSLPVCK